MGDGFDVIAGDGNGHLRAVLLVDVVNANLAQFVGGFAAMKAEGAEVAVDFGEGLVRDVETGESAIFVQFLPDGIMDWPAYAPPGCEFRLVGRVDQEMATVLFDEVLFQ